MEYESDFYLCFMERTQQNLDSYEGGYDATQLLNSLLGLLIVPKEKLFDQIPDTSLNELSPSEWGDVSSWVTQNINGDLGHGNTSTLRQFVRKLRNSVAHFHITPHHESGVVRGFRFAYGSFNAEIPEGELKKFVKQLASTLVNLQGSSA